MDTVVFLKIFMVIAMVTIIGVFVYAILFTKTPKKD